MQYLCQSENPLPTQQYTSRSGSDKKLQDYPKSGVCYMPSPGIPSALMQACWRRRMKKHKGLRGVLINPYEPSLFPKGQVATFAWCLQQPR